MQSFYSLLVIIFILHPAISGLVKAPPRDLTLGVINANVEERELPQTAENPVNAIVPLCADQNEDWRSPGQFNLQDCERALNELSNIYVRGQEKLPYEYLNRTTNPVRKGLHKSRLPLKLAVSTSDRSHFPSPR